MNLYRIFRGLLLFLIFFQEGYLSAQQTIVELTGKVIDETTNKSVSYALISNLTTERVIAADSGGYFHMTLMRKDVLKISVLGYETKYFTINDPSIDFADILLFRLPPKTYALANVDIFESRWKDLVFEFSHTDIQKNIGEDRLEFLLKTIGKDLYWLSAVPTMHLPLRFPSKAEKQRKKIRKMQREEILQDLIFEKYNLELVRQLTGLNKNEAYKFMAYCNFKKEFLLESTEYDIAREIDKRFAVYYKKRLAESKLQAH